MLIESVGGNAEASRLAGVRSRSLIILALRLLGPVRRHRRAHGQLRASRAPTATTPASGSSSTRSSRSSSAARRCAGGRFFLAGTLDRRAAHPDADDDHLHDRHPAGDDAALQGARRHRRRACIQSPKFRAKRASAALATAGPDAGRDGRPPQARRAQVRRVSASDDARPASASPPARQAAAADPGAVRAGARDARRCSSRMFVVGGDALPGLRDRPGRSSTCSSTTRSCSSSPSG